MSGPVIVDGAVLIGADGKIEEVGPAARVARPEGAESIELPDAVVLPGLVNLHTHLELTSLGGTVEDDDFFRWISHLRDAKRELSPQAFRAAAEQGVRDAWRWGTTTVADTGDSGAVADALTALGGRGVVYHEVFGPHPQQADDALAQLASAVAELSARAGDTVRIGVSPHAPYTVSRPLYRKVAAYARKHRLPMAVHIAESHAETQLVTRGTGPFAEAWRRREIPPFETARSPVGLLDELGVLGQDVLAIHGVQVDSADARVLAERGCAVAVCPHANLRHGHGPPPVEQFVAAGVLLGIGTDSVASVPTLDLFREMRHTRDLGGLGPEDVVRAATLNGARALGLESEIGTLQRGKWADLCALRLPDDAWTTPGSLAAWIAEAGTDAVLRTYVAGRCVYDAGLPRAGARERGL